MIAALKGKRFFWPRNAYPGRKINLLRHSTRERRERFLEDHPEVLRSAAFRSDPDPLTEKYATSLSSEECTVTNYKYTVTVDLDGIPGLPKKMEMEEIVVSSAELDAQD